MTEIKSVARIQTLTLLASARANPPPSKIITPIVFTSVARELISR
jgi:hypothetical protein